MVTHGKSRVELALDLGEVKAGEHHTPICELELERLTGETADLLALAESLVTEPGLRQDSAVSLRRALTLHKAMRRAK